MKAAMEGAMDNATPLRIVRVDWLDAHGGTRRGWRPRGDLVKLAPAHAVAIGVLLRDDASFVVVCPHLVGDERGLDPADPERLEGDGEIAIPRGWIVAVTNLGVLA